MSGANSGNTLQPWCRNVFSCLRRYLRRVGVDALFQRVKRRQLVAHQLTYRGRQIRFLIIQAVPQFLAQLLRRQRCDHAELGEQSAQSVDQCCALLDQTLTQPVHRQSRLLLH